MQTTQQSVVFTISTLSNYLKETKTSSIQLWYHEVTELSGTKQFIATDTTTKKPVGYLFGVPFRNGLLIVTVAAEYQDEKISEAIALGLVQNVQKEYPFLYASVSC